MPNLPISRQRDRPVLVTIKTDRQVLLELATFGLVAQPVAQPSADQVQLGLGHCALQAQHEPVVEVPRTVDPVDVGDQRAGQGAQIKQLTPVRVVARQPRDLSAQDQPNAAEPDLCNQILETQPAVGRGARTSQVFVDDRDRLRRPAKLDRPLPQPVLQRARLVVVLHLTRR
jgi:hypothetical protein